MSHARNKHTITSKTVHARQIVQILGNSEIFVVGENVLINETMLELTDDGGVPLTNCSMISSQMKNGHEAFPLPPSRTLQTSFMGTASLACSIFVSHSSSWICKSLFAERLINSSFSN